MSCEHGFSSDCFQCFRNAVNRLTEDRAELVRFRDREPKLLELLDFIEMEVDGYFQNATRATVALAREVRRLCITGVMQDAASAASKSASSENDSSNH